MVAGWTARNEITCKRTTGDDEKRRSIRRDRVDAMTSRRRTVYWLITVLFGALVATTGDHLHVVYGVLFYPHPVLFRQAWWVIPLFAGAMAAMLAGSELVRKVLGGEVVGASLVEALLATGAFFVAYAFTAVAAELPTFVLVVLGVTWLPRVRAMPRWVVAFALVAAVCGTGFEAGLSRLGGFAYVRPDWLGVPRWLPGLYLHAALAAARIRGLL
jgi:hypothetical protein